MRTATIRRDTRETRIAGTLKIEGRGRYQVATGIRFFDHMLELFAKHGGFDLTLKADGDLDVDQHHTVEDVGIVLGQLFDKALADRRGINRAGYFVLPMDETLAVVALDLGDAPHSSTRTSSRSDSSATCRPNLRKTSSTASSPTPAPTCTPRCCTAGRTITSSRPSSSVSRAP